ncbi:MAG: bifunctional riboflavin kinase/FAD synthetase [Candidatus Krumholzibacteriota bacterium]|nr:bifunctional riboflavin kinase/FAD synthetase [Candidatus Krumholzibacteriota bacterium]
MKIISKTEDIKKGIEGESAVTIGVFDGVHAGHQQVINTLVDIKERETLDQNIVFTFDRHPLSFIKPRTAPQLLTTMEEKISLLEPLGIDYLVIEKVSGELLKMDYVSFIEKRLIERWGMTHLVVGYDFRLGKDREGSLERIKREGKRDSFGLTVVPPENIEGNIVSSTIIRADVSAGRTEDVVKYLTREYFFDALVVRGKNIGRELDFPTANLVVDNPDKLIPAEGVYAVSVEIGGTRRAGMMNIGTSPTVKSDNKKRIEVHLFDFSEDIYGETLRVHCGNFIRKERLFGSYGELRKQLIKDRELIRGIFKENERGVSP